MTDMLGDPTTMIESAHEVMTVSGERVAVITQDDLNRLFSEFKSFLLRWILGVGVILLVGATTAVVRMDNRQQRSEQRNATDSAQIAELQEKGSIPLRNILHDLEQTRQQMAALQAAMSDISKEVVDLRVALARAGRRP